jgi:hypothetical protein
MVVSVIVIVLLQRVGVRIGAPFENHPALMPVTELLVHKL